MEKKRFDAGFRAALGAVLDYLSEDEARNFEEAGQPENHIFRHLEILRRELEADREDGGLASTS